MTECRQSRSGRKITKDNDQGVKNQPHVSHSHGAAGPTPMGTQESPAAASGCRSGQEMLCDECTLTIEQNYRENPLELDSALKMAQRGIHVLPVRQDKAPSTPHGVHDATTEPEIMERWYRSYPVGVGHGTCQQRSGLGP